MIPFDSFDFIDPARQSGEADGGPEPSEVVPARPLCRRPSVRSRRRSRNAA
jgi:hypothetical protein